MTNMTIEQSKFLFLTIARECRGAHMLQWINIFSYLFDIFRQNQHFLNELEFFIFFHRIYSINYS